MSMYLARVRFRICSMYAVDGTAVTQGLEFNRVGKRVEIASPSPAPQRCEGRHQMYTQHFLLSKRFQRDNQATTVKNQKVPPTARLFHLFSAATVLEMAGQLDWLDICRVCGCSKYPIQVNRILLRAAKSTALPW
jgi:hypothetical protein